MLPATEPVEAVLDMADHQWDSSVPARSSPDRWTVCGIVPHLVTVVAVFDAQSPAVSSGYDSTLPASRSPAEAVPA
jgi:hypothetical protein